MSHIGRKQARQAPRPMHAPEKRGYATKENVHQVAKPAKPAMKPDAFMRQMGIDDLLVDYQDALNDFYHEESYESYIPSVDAGAFGRKSTSLQQSSLNYTLEHVAQKLILSSFLSIADKTAETIGFGLINSMDIPTEKIGRALPGIHEAEEAEIFWSYRQSQTGNNFYALPKFLASLWSAPNAGALLLLPTPVKSISAGVKMASRVDFAVSRSRYGLFGKFVSKIRVNGTEFNYNKTLKEVFKILEKNQCRSDAVVSTQVRH